MWPGGPNPTQLQNAPTGSANTPLVLIHDGGGTTFAYFFLGDLKRDVWAVHDPNYWDGKAWAGGMEEMAKHYIILMRNAGIRGKILLGGWSLGGHLAITISRLIARDPTALFHVAGTMIIDSPFHIPIAKLDEPLVDPDFGEMPELVQKAFKNCDIYLDTWELPTWTGPANGKKTLKLTAGGKDFNIEQGQALHLPLSGEWRVRDGKTFDAYEETDDPIAPPPGILIRALKRSARPPGVDRDCTIDRFRDEPLLGWEGKYPDYIKATFDVDTAHFDMFDKANEEKLDQVSNRLDQGCQILDSLMKSGQ